MLYNSIMASQVKKKRGRPTVANPATEQFPSIRVTKDKLEEYRQAAESDGLSFSQWVKSVLDRAVKISLRKMR